MLKLSIIFVSLLLTISCHRSSVSSKIFSNNSTIPKDLEITFQQTPCYGNCWVYNLKINPDGKIFYDGIKNVEKTGKFEDKLSEEQIKDLIIEFSKSDYFDLADDYNESNCPSFITDSPIIITSIKINGEYKRITHNLGCLEQGKNHIIYPQKLYDLEIRIPLITNSAKWTGTK